MAYGYDPFSLPVDGMKIPEWLMSSEPPVDTFAIADKARAAKQQEKLNELNAMAGAMKIAQALREQDTNDRIAEVAKQNVGLPLNDFAKKAMEVSMQSGSPEDALKWAGVVFNNQKNAEAMAQKELDRISREGIASDRADLMSRAQDIRSQQLAAQLSLMQQSQELNNRKLDEWVRAQDKNRDSRDKIADNNLDVKWSQIDQKDQPKYNDQVYLSDVEGNIFVGSKEEAMPLRASGNYVEVKDVMAGTPVAPISSIKKPQSTNSGRWAEGYINGKLVRKNLDTGEIR